MSSSIRAILLGVAALVVCTPAVGSGRSQDAPGPHVRPLSVRLANAIEFMQHRSPTFAALLARLDASDVIVHLVEHQGPCPGGVNSCLVMVTDQGGHRYLRIMIRSMQAYDAMIVQIAHEMEHAAEIASRPQIRAGGHTCDGMDWRASGMRCESRAAQTFARKVFDEIRAER